MWIQVRTFDGKNSSQVDNLSKLTKVEELKKKLEEIFDVESGQQRLFYRGKQLEGGHTLFDYDVGLNDIVQLMIQVPRPASPTSKPTENGVKSPEKTTDCCDKQTTSETIDENSNEILGLYKAGDIVDAKDLDMGAWFEAKVAGLSLEENSKPSKILYHVQFDGYEENEISKLSEKDVRPRARVILQWNQLCVGQVVMANYNTDEPKERGFWYDVEITRKVEAATRNGKKLFAKLLLKEENGDNVSQECELLFTDEIFKIPVHTDGENENGLPSPARRQNKPDCDRCKDDASKNCKYCACSECGGKEDPDKQLLCDECDQAFHLHCLNPPLDKIPDEDEWYCPVCKNDASEVIKAGEKLRTSKKKQKMASANSQTERDWGRGMACVGRTKVCTVVPSNHFGPIPGVPVGSSWMFRIGASEAGVHRPHVSGIHGREDEGAFSIVLAGGYEDDLDHGDEFYYTGSGGRDLSGNKRTAEQSCDQTLTKMNRALAKNCAAALDEKNRVTAKNWKNGKPVRVIRSSKFKKHSKFAPDIGNRYDGIYKIAEYWPEKGQSGFLIRRYLLRRDDEEPAPWTKAGKKRIEELGLVMQYPGGYLEAQEKKRLEKEAKDEAKSEKGSKGKRKRGKCDSPALSEASPVKKKAFAIAKDKMDLIREDDLNKKVWDEILSSYENFTEFHKKVEEAFTCICCQEIASQPVTTDCKHNTCKLCLTRSFKAGVFACPTCRHDIGKDNTLPINKPLYEALNDIFPGYDKGR